MKRDASDNGATTAYGRDPYRWRGVVGRVIVAGLLLSGILLSAAGATAAGKTLTGARQITFAPLGANGTMKTSLRVTATLRATSCLADGAASDSSYRCFAKPFARDPVSPDRSHRARAVSRRPRQSRARLDGSGLPWGLSSPAAAEVETSSSISAWE